MSGARSLALAWYGGLLGGLLPILLLGFLYSALADRTVFVLWALVVGAFWVVALREGLGAGWARLRLLGALALLLAAGLAVFAWLEWRHHEILDLGFRAVFPAVYHPRATSPRTMGALAGVCGLGGAACLILARGPHLPGPPLPKGEEGEKQNAEPAFPSLPLGERGQGSEGHDGAATEETP